MPSLQNEHIHWDFLLTRELVSKKTDNPTLVLCKSTGATEDV